MRTFNLEEYKKRILITGGAGFIGSHVVRLFVNKYPDYLIVNYDKLTYAGNLENLKDIQDKENYVFIKGDICDQEYLNQTIGLFDITDIIHLAAESHVDRSIANPMEFVQTNVIGTVTLLNVAKKYWTERGGLKGHRFHHVSTDEVYGALDMNPDNKFKESTKYAPHSPYSASKASSDHFVHAYHDTFGIDVTISNCSNNYGPNQFPEKLIPLVINKLKNKETIPVYGTGENVRDWLYVEDHAKAIDLIFHNGISGETYNIGGNHEMSNIDIVKKIIEVYVDEIMADKRFEFPERWREYGFKKFNDKIQFVTDRAGHDLRYAIDCSKLEKELGWRPDETFGSGIKKTVKWYLENSEWLEHVVSGEYQDWMNKNYTNR